MKLTGAKIVTQLISLLSIMLLSRFRSLQEYGTYSQMLLAINLIITIFMVGLPNSINYFLARAESEEERKKFLSTYYFMSTLLGALSGIILVFSIPLLIDYFRNPMIETFWYLLMVMPWTQIVLSSIDNVLIVYGQMHRLTFFKVFCGSVTLACILIVQACGWTFKEYLILYLIGQIFCALCVYWFVNHLEGRLPIKLEKNYLKVVFTFSIPLALGSVMGTLKTELDKLMVSLFFSTEEVAVYTNSAKELPVTIIASSFTAILLPQITRLVSKSRIKEAVELWKETILLSFTFMCFFVAGIVTYAPDVIKLLYSDKYLSGVTIFRVYSFILLFRTTYFGMFLNAIGKTKFLFYSSVIILGIDGVLNYIGIKYFGIVGPALGTVLTTVVSAFITLVFTSNTISVSLKNLFPWKGLAKILSLNILFSVSFWGLKVICPVDKYLDSVLESLILGFVWGMVYLAVTWKYIKQKWNYLNNKNVE